MTPRCTWTSNGWTTAEHLATCDIDCAGCRPCPKSHCELNGCSNHVEHGAGIFTCPSCIGKTRRTIRAILTRYAELPAEYEYSDIDDEPLNLHGPAADTGQWAERRKRLERAYAERGWCDYPKHAGMADDDPHHPLAVLGRWDIAIRESYGHASDLFVTISRAVDYLTGPVLDTFAHTREFEEFAKETRTCLNHLEDVLALVQRSEQGAPCPTCSDELKDSEDRAPRLEKRVAEHHPKMKDGEVCQVGAPDCRVCRGDNDTWHCSRNPAHHWDDASYRGRVDGDYVQHATALPTRELAKRIGKPVSTVRRWAGRTYLGTDEHGEATYGEPRLKATGRAADGRKTYSVAEALRLAESNSAVMLDIKSLDVSKSG
jgi:hypothetical protein